MEKHFTIKNTDLRAGVLVQYMLIPFFILVIFTLSLSFSLPPQLYTCKSQQDTDGWPAVTLSQAPNVDYKIKRSWLRGSHDASERLGQRCAVLAAIIGGEKKVILLMHSSYYSRSSHSVMAGRLIVQALTVHDISNDHRQWYCLSAYVSNSS